MIYVLLLCHVSQGLTLTALDLPLPAGR